MLQHCYEEDTVAVAFYKWGNWEQPKKVVKGHAANKW